MNELKNDIFDNADYKARYRHLMREMAEGRITELSIFPKLKLSDAKIPYTPIFGYRSVEGQMVYEDFKGNTEPWVLRVIKKMWKLWGDGKLQIIRRKGDEFRVTQWVLPEDESGDVNGNR